MADEEYDDLDALLNEDEFDISTEKQVNNATNPKEETRFTADDSVKRNFNDGNCPSVNDHAREFTDDATNDELKDIREMLKKMTTDESFQDINEEKLNSVINKNNTKSKEKAEYNEVLSNTMKRFAENSAKAKANSESNKTADDLTKDSLEELISMLAGTEGASKNIFKSNSGDSKEDDDFEFLDQFLDGMMTKALVYEPMKKAQRVVDEAIESHKNDETKKKIYDDYVKQKIAIDKLVEVYERPDYEDGKFKDEINVLMDDLQEAGELPGTDDLGDLDLKYTDEMEKAFEKAFGVEKGSRDRSKETGIDGPDLEELNKMMDNDCAQQ